MLNYLSIISSKIQEESYRAISREEAKMIVSRLNEISPEINEDYKNHKICNSDYSAQSQTGRF